MAVEPFGEVAGLADVKGRMGSAAGKVAYPFAYYIHSR